MAYDHRCRFFSATKLKTACRRSFTGTSVRFPIEFSSSGYAVVTAWLPRPELFCPEKPSHATIPKNLELDTAKQLVQWIGLSQSKFYDWRKRYEGQRA